MLAIEENISLKPFNTLGVNVNARYLAYVNTNQQLSELVDWAHLRHLPIRVIGGGSNVLFTKDQDALVLIMQTKGIELVAKNGSQHIIEVAAGEVWHDLVRWSLDRGLGGLENLSLIPGTLGAAPVQNIGAYGVEFKDVCQGVTAFNCDTNQVECFSNEQCRFGYRDSMFKQYPNRWIILSARLVLDSSAPLHINYAALKAKLPQDLSALNYRQVSQLVCETRLEKLPDPNVLGNAGSFFKNPIVSVEQADKLIQQYPDLVTYPYTKTMVKLAAGWLIDRAGLKGYREGDVGVYPKQALVLVNYGDAEGSDIVHFSNMIQQKVKKQFNVTLEPEPVFY